MSENKKRPRIGIPGWKMGENSFGCGVNHLDFISTFGDPVILFPQDDNVELDMLYLPGGPDVSPQSYGQIPGFYTGNCDLFRQYFFEKNLGKYIEKGTPVFGVCLGMQMLNVHFGGTLTQNLRNHAQSRERWGGAHDVYIAGGTKKDKFEVNSHHHQAVLRSNISSELTPLLYSVNEDDGDDPIIEGFRHRDLPIVGVQYHPEEWRDNFSKNLILKLLNS